MQHVWNRRGVVLAVIFAALTGSLVAQEKSVKPGINDSFKNPNVQEFVTRFEGESREVYDKRFQIVDACGIKKGQAIADIGAGTGLFTRLFSEAVSKEGKVYAVDISQKFLDHINTSAKKQKIENITTVLGTDISPKLPENSVDVVFICDTYHHFEYPFRMLDSIHKALKPGGRLIIIDFVRIEGKSKEWTLNHVRAGQEVVEKEITSSGFRKQTEIPKIVTENYMVVFEKVAPKTKK
ncbi:MAG: class I SAM-dependent methyltransferase [Zavarzinella sp.]